MPRPWPGSINQVNVEFLPKGLHDMGQAGMSGRLKEVLAAVDKGRYDAIVLGYALCSNGLVGHQGRADSAGSFPAPTTASRSSWGARSGTSNTFSRHPGVYYKTSGWIERGEGLTQYREESIAESRACCFRSRSLRPSTAKTMRGASTNSFAT